MEFQVTVFRCSMESKSALASLNLPVRIKWDIFLFEWYSNCGVLSVLVTEAKLRQHEIPSWGIFLLLSFIRAPYNVAIVEVETETRTTCRFADCRNLFCLVLSASERPMC